MSPIIILAPGRSFTSVISAMLGQHPQLYDVPELNLNVTDTMEEWWLRYHSGFAFTAHGLLRAVAEIHFGDQSDASVKQAWLWLRLRLKLTTSELFRDLAKAVQPCTLVEKSPTMATNAEMISRYSQTFPEARYLHLVRHPRATGRSMLSTDWARACIAYGGAYDNSTTPPTLDAQIVWYEVHSIICAFLETVPAHRILRVRGEDVLEQPDLCLKQITESMGIRSDAEAISAMMHPENSPFACIGPPMAKYGSDPSFLERPELRPYAGQRDSLDGPLEWRNDGIGFSPEVRKLAEVFGYS